MADAKPTPPLCWSVGRLEPGPNGKFSLFVVPNVDAFVVLGQRLRGEVAREHRAELDARVRTGEVNPSALDQADAAAREAVCRRVRERRRGGAGPPGGLLRRPA
jgi:hypothetical protein